MTHEAKNKQKHKHILSFIHLNEVILDYVGLLKPFGSLGSVAHSFRLVLNNGIVKCCLLRPKGKHNFENIEPNLKYLLFCGSCINLS